MISQTAKREYSETENLSLNVAFMGTGLSEPLITQLPGRFNLTHFRYLDHLKEHLDNQSILTLPEIILIETDPAGACFDIIAKIKKNPLWRDLIVVLIATEKNKEQKMRALKLKVHDYYILPFPIEHLIERLNFLVKFKLIKPQLSALEDADVVYHLPPSKRILDIFISAVGLIILSPLMILVALIIRLDSKGPIIYKSKRVGTGYNIFNFYKFRSMYQDADARLNDYSKLNRYVSEDGDESRTAFVKILNDPRVTPFGAFIRRTSIDELPQLFNVLRGDMSLVGNRPLPLYEAEMLTSNEWSLRFMGPAGVTGLWQVKSRGKRDISERERKKFDNFYALKYSFWFDIEIMIKTLPVILYKEKY